MSFADWSQSPSGSGRSFGMNPYPSNHSANDIDGYFQIISNNIRQITANVAEIKQNSDKLGTPKDSQEIREDLRRLIEETRTIAKDTTTALKNAQLEVGPPEQRNRRKLQHQKLLQDLQNVLQRFQEYSKVSAEKERTVPLPKRTSFAKKQDSFWSEPVNKNEEKQGLLDQGKLQALENDTTYYDNLVKERDQEIKQIEATVFQVNEIFRDVAKLVAEQGTMIDNIESNIQETSVHTTKAVAELRQANEYQKSSRSKMCWIALILMVVIAVLVFIVYFLVPK